MHNKIKTGMKGLDKILLGGLIENRSYVILGFAGTGKTILSLQWLIEGIRLGDKCLYITLGELREDIESNIANFGWSLDGIDILDLTIPINSKKNKPIEQYHIFTPDEVEQSYTWDAIYQAIAKEAPKRVVIDSASHLRFLSTDIYQFRKHILMLTNYLNRRGVTSMLLFDPTQMGKDASLSMAVDGILRLRMKNSEGNIIGLRYLEVEKYRGSDFLSGYHPFKIGNTGIKIFYHRAEKIGRGNLTGEFFHSGIKRLDKMLGGGIESGTTTIISGSTGTGKSSLASQFLTHSAMQGTPGLAILFEESTDVFIHRCHTNGIPIDDLIKKNMLKLVQINPMEMYPDELLLKIRRYIRNGNYKLVLIDSLRGYILAMEEFGIGTLMLHLHNLITYLNYAQVTTFLINEIEAITGNLKVTEYGLSRFGDNIILLRFSERSSNVIKIIGCLKKRLGNFQPEFREISITSKGITLSKKLNNVGGLLTGFNFFNTESDSI